VNWPETAAQNKGHSAREHSMAGNIRKVLGNIRNGWRWY